MTVSDESKVELPREVYLQSCANICKPFESEGFRFAKSGPRMSKKSGDFIFEVSFQSSHYNTTGQSVAIWIHANVLSNAMKHWRSKNKTLVSESRYVAGGQIGNLIKPASWLEWNVARSEFREHKIQTAVDAVRNIALPYFSAFEDVPQLCKRLASEAIPCMDIQNRLDFLACYSNANAVHAAARQFVMEDEIVVADIVRTVQALRQGETPDWKTLSFRSIVIAKAIVVFTLDVGQLLAA